MDTVGFVNLIRSYIQPGRIPVVDKLAAPYTPPDQGSLKVKYGMRGLSAGSVLSVGWSDFYVWGYDPSSKTATVQDGWGGSPQRPAGIDELLQVMPRWTDWQLLQQANAELRSLSGQGGLWERLVCYHSWDGAHRAFNLEFERDVDRVLMVEAESARTWEWWQLNPSSYRLTASAHSDEYPSGQSLTLYDLDFLTPGRRLRITGSAPLLPLEPDAFDAAAAVGLAESAIDVPALGVAARLASLEEGRRQQLDAQGDPRRAEQVSMSAWTAVGRDLRRLYDRRLAEERSNLLAYTPYRRGV